MNLRTLQRHLPVVAALVAMVLAGLLFVPLPPALRTPLGASLLNSLHYPVFGFLAFAGRLLLVRFGKLRDGTANTVALVVVLFTAFGVEVIQPAFGRGGSLEDALIGAAGAVMAALIPFSFRSRALISLWLVLVLGGGALVSRPAWKELLAIRHRDAAFPLLGTFEADAELSYWIAAGYLSRRPYLVSRSTNHVTEGRHSLHVSCTKGKWPGVFMTIGGQDWRAHDALELDLFNPGKPFELGIRLDDDHPDSEFWGYRYDGLFEPTNGWNHIRIPMRDIENGGWRRKMNLASIQRMILFVDWKQKPCEWYLDNVRLVKAAAAPATPQRPAPTPTNSPPPVGE